MHKNMNIEDMTIQNEIFSPCSNTLIGRNKKHTNEIYRKLQKNHSKFMRDKIIEKRKKVHIETRRIISQLKLPVIVLNETNYMYQKIQASIPKGSKVLGLNNLIPVLIYISCKIHNYSISIEKLLEYSRVVDIKLFKKAQFECSLILKQNNIKITPCAKGRILNQVVTILKKIKNNIKLTVDLNRVFENLAQALQGIREKTQIALLTYLTLKMLNEKINQKVISEICDIHPRKLRKSLNRLLSKTNLIRQTNIKTINELCILAMNIEKVEVKIEVDKNDRKCRTNSSSNNRCIRITEPSEENKKEEENSNSIIFYQWN